MKLKKRLFAGSLSANFLNVGITLSCGYAFFDLWESDKEIEEFFLRKCKEHFPEKDGYHDHKSSCTEIPSEVIKTVSGF